jgi:hypothetical protein
LFVASPLLSFSAWLLGLVVCCLSSPLILSLVARLGCLLPLLSYQFTLLILLAGQHCNI